MTNFRVRENTKESCCTYLHLKLHLSEPMCRLFYSLTSRGNIVIRGALFMYTHTRITSWFPQQQAATCLSPPSLLPFSLVPSIPSSHPSFHIIFLSSSLHLSVQESIETQSVFLMSVVVYVRVCVCCR